MRMESWRVVGELQGKKVLYIKVILYVYHETSTRSDSCEINSLC